MTNTEDQIIKLSKTAIHVDTLDIEGTSVRYITAGAGPTVLLLHGANMGWGQWYSLIPELAQHFTVHALDFPGAGESTHINTDLLDFQKHFIDLTFAFIKQLKLQPIHVIGHSVGAWVALNLAAREPQAVRSLILISPLGFSTFNSPRQSLIGIKAIAKLLSKTALKPTRKNMDSFLRGAMHKPHTLAEAFSEYYFQSVQKHPSRHPFLFINRLAGPVRVRKQFRAIQILPLIKQPTLIIVGKHDPIVNFKAVTKYISKLEHGEIKVLPDTGHVPFIEEASICNNAILNFLKNKN